MNPPDQPCQATPAGDLRQQILDSRVPKNEREWWASRTIEKLERELTETERLRFGADADRRRLRCELAAANECVAIANRSADDQMHQKREAQRELAAAKAEASHYMAVAQKATDELIFLRADNLKAHQMTCAAALERDAEREKVRVLREALDEAQSCGGLTGSIFMQARAALAATKEGTP